VNPRLGRRPKATGVKHSFVHAGTFDEKRLSAADQRQVALNGRASPLARKRAARCLISILRVAACGPPAFRFEH